MGDALGARLEGMSREQISTLQGITADYQPFFRRTKASDEIQYPLGQYTDDTQLTLAIVKSLLASGRVDGAAIAAEFVRLWQRVKLSVPVRLPIGP